MEIVKQPDFQVFASEAKSGEVLEFPNILRGWGVTLDQTQGKPPLEWMNDAFKRIDINNLYQLQQGIPEWNKSVRYPVNAIVKHADKIYLCLAENENNEPHLNSDKWTLYVKKATTSQAGITQLTSTLSDREDVAATPKMVNDVNRTASTAQKTANTANDKANSAQTTANQATSAAATADSKAVQAQTRADSAYSLASSKQDKLTFTGTGNVARMSEIDKKREIDDFSFWNRERTGYYTIPQAKHKGSLRLASWRSLLPDWNSGIEVSSTYTPGVNGIVVGEVNANVGPQADLVFTVGGVSFSLTYSAINTVVIPVGYEDSIVKRSGGSRGTITFYPYKD